MTRSIVATEPVYKAKIISAKNDLTSAQAKQRLQEVLDKYGAIDPALAQAVQEFNLGDADSTPANLSDGASDPSELPQQTSKPIDTSVPPPYAHLRTEKEIDAMPGDEVAEKRTECAKLFSLGENIYQAVLYPIPVHYHDSETGQWLEIDNTLVSEQSENGSILIKNKANGDLKVQIASGDATSTVQLQNAAGNQISWSIQGASSIQPIIQEPAPQTMSFDRRSQAVANTESAAAFSDILPKIDMVCHITGSTFKDDIIFKTIDAVQPITLSLNSTNLKPTRKKDAAIAWLDEDNNTAFIFAPPTLVDQSQENGPVTIDLAQQSEHEWTLTYTPDTTWMSNAAYPVVLDPYVITELDANAIQDNYVSSANPSTVYSQTATTLRVSYNNSTYGTCMAFMKFKQENLPQIDSSYYITKATLKLAMQSGGNGSIPIYLREVLGSWNPQTINYNNMPAVAAEDIDFIAPTSSSGYQANFYYDITNLLRKWYDGTNNGLRLDTRATSNMLLNSADNSSNKPYALINYMSLAGLESYLAYEEHDLGRAGALFVSLYNGNLILRHTDTTCNGNLMPVSISHFYNSCDSASDRFHCGNGWKHSLHIALHRAMLRDDSGSDKLYYILTDGDGTRHHFKAVGTSTTEYEDMSGLFMKLTISGTTVSIRDKSDGIMTFDLPTVNSNGTDANFKLVKTIKDAMGNTATVASSNGQITSVTDGAGRVTTISLGSQSRPSEICAPGFANNGVNYTYNTAGRLTEITHEDGAVSQYSYNAYGLLSQVTNAEGRSINITYTDSAPYRVTMIDEIAGSTFGNLRQYEYMDSLTKITDFTTYPFHTLFYHFNDNGNVVSVNDDLGYAVFAKFTGSVPINHPESESKMQRTVVNLVKNHDFETVSDWSGVGGTYYGDGGYLGSRCGYFNNLVSGMNYFQQSVPAEPGETYTLSCYAKRTDNIDFWFAYQYYINNVGWETEHSLSMKNNIGTTEFQRASFTFTVPEYAEADSINIYIISGVIDSEQTPGTARFDCVQLEKGPVSNRYNLLENGDFSRNVNAAPSGWTASSANTSADIVISSSYSIGKPAGMPPNVLRLNGAANKMTRVHQDLPYSGGHGDSYVIGGWARTLTRPSRGELDLCNIVVYYKTSSSSTYVEAGNVSWSEEWSDWQYACASVVIPQNYTGLRFAVLYQYNVNYTEFAGLHMFKEDFGKSYVYDNAGNVVSATNLAGYNSDATYDSYNNMLSYRAPGSTYLTTLNYGSTDAEKKQHLLRSGQTPQGVKQSYTYDDKGNITSTQQSGTGSSAFLKTTTAYTTNKNYPATITNTRGKTITNEYDQTLGTLTSLTDPDGQVLNYQYDLLNRTINTLTTASSKTYRNDYVYSNDKLSQVKHNTTSNTSSDVVLNFAYDALGNRTSTKIGSQTAALSTMVYSGSGDQLPIRTEFGNGGKIHYDRDEFKRIKEIRVDDDDFPICEYDYDANGNVGRFHDGNLGASGITTTYEYDLSNRLVRARSMDYNYHEYTTEYAYSERNLVSKFKEIVGENRLTYETNYQYDFDNRPTNIAFGSTNPSLTYAYDAIGRTTSRKLADGTNNYTSTFAYLAGGQGTNSATQKISSITQSGMNFSYVYDNRGNVSSETRGSTATSYQYDEIGQLTRVNSASDSKTWTFEYDRGGNLLNRKRYAYTTGSLGTVQETISYTYGDSNWKDKLTNYNGTAITYDVIGNPLYDGTWTYTWQAGRQLTHMANTNHNLYFQYSAKGQRTSKLYDDSTATVYTWNGNTLTHLVKDANILHFWHDAAGLPTMVRFNGADYFYIYNLQGDVVGLVQKGTTNVVVEYTYDAWGKLLSTSGTLASTLGAANPFRYRAYIYDDETGLYYLKDRYYNPVWGRFLNADLELGAIGQPLSHNLYAYCNNNPVSYADPTGASAAAVLGTASTAAAFNPLLGLFVLVAGFAAVAVGSTINKATSTSKPAAKQVQKTTPTVKISITTPPMIPPPPVEKIVFDPTVGGQTPADLQIIVQQAALKSSAVEKDPQGLAVHHIVAQADQRAAASRAILARNSISSNDDDNLISITQKLHQYLHTTLYYKTVENLLNDAADKAHNPYAEEIFVRLTLNGIGTVLEGVDYAFFR